MEEMSTPTDPAPYLALVRMSPLGPAAARRLLDLCGSAEAVLALTGPELEQLGLPARLINALRRPDWRAVRGDLKWLESGAAEFIHWHDPRYPGLLKEIPDPPVGLFVCGRTACLEGLQIAVVGSRNPSPSGRRLAREFAAALGTFGISVVSGMATGVDSLAHAGALDAGGATTAVLGNGLGHVYPPGNRELAGRIAEQGLLVSEFPPEVKPLAANFPRRNRIISGLCAGVLVVEAALKSGSLITARYAMEQGREVFAVPGSVFNPVTRGCHALLRQGAKLTETVEDILEEIGGFAGALADQDKSLIFQQHNESGLDAGGKLLLDNIGDAPVTIDQLVDLTRVSVDEISAGLLDLELRGLVESVAGGAYIRRV